MTYTDRQISEDTIAILNRDRVVGRVFKRSDVWIPVCNYAPQVSPSASFSDKESAVYWVIGAHMMALK